MQTYLKTVMAAIAIAAFWSIDATAAEDGRRGKDGKGGKAGKAKFLERFDTDGDGQLSEQEKAAAREAMQQAGKRRGPGAAEPKAGEWQEAGKPGEEARRPGRGGPGRPGGPGTNPQAEAIKKFDLDGDGRLNEAERRAAMKAHMKDIDINGDGQISDEERMAAMLKRINANPEMKAKLLARFDANKDGELTADELPQQMFNGRGGPGGKGGFGQGGEKPGGKEGKRPQQGTPGGGIGAPPVDKAI